MVSKGGVLHLTSGLLKSQDTQKCAFALLQVHIGQACGHGRQVFVPGHTIEHGAAIRFDHINGHSHLLRCKN
jgi:hypothetical protein